MGGFAAKEHHNNSHENTTLYPHSESASSFRCFGNFLSLSTPKTSQFGNFRHRPDMGRLPGSEWGALASCTAAGKQPALCLNAYCTTQDMAKRRIPTKSNANRGNNYLRRRWRHGTSIRHESNLAPKSWFATCSCNDHTCEVLQLFVSIALLCNCHPMEDCWAS